MARKTGRVTTSRKRTTLRDLRATKATTVRGGASTVSPGFQGCVRMASADYAGDGVPAVKQLSS